MKVFVVYEIDFGSWEVLDIFDSIDKAKVLQVNKESENTLDWVSYTIQEWGVK